MTKGMGMSIQVTEVQKALKGVDYPATSSQLADHAEQNGADAEVVEALRGMGEETFDGPSGVMQGLKGTLGGPNG
jgi:Protein of unknown function (DUF2795)